MFSRKLTAVSASILMLCAGAAIASDLKVSGLVSTGVFYSKFDHQDADFIIAKGQNTDQVSRLTISARESLGEDRFVQMTLESALDPATGSIRQYPNSADRLFSRQSSLTVGNRTFELALGRIGTITSPNGPYSFYSRLGMNPTRSALGELGVGGMTINHHIVDNAVVLDMKTPQNVIGTILYSNGDVTADGVDQEQTLDWSDRRHLMQGALGWRSNKLRIGLIYTHEMPVINANNGMRKDAADMIHATAGWNFDGFGVSGTLFYAKNTTLAFGTPVAKMGVAPADLAVSNEGLETKSFYLGLSIPRGPHFLSLSGGYGKTTWKGETAASNLANDEGDLWTVAGVYRYSFSKRTNLYFAAARVDGSDLTDAASRHIVTTGINHSF